MSRPSLADKILPKYFRDELDRILIHNNQKNHSVRKSIPSDSSKKTRLERRNGLRLIFAELWQLGYKLKSPTALKPKHLHALCSHWQQKNLGVKTIHGLFSNIRAFCRWIDKEGMLQDISTYFNGREHLVRQTATTEDFSWEAKGIDIDEFIEKARQLDQRLPVLIELQRHFGLRTREAIEFRPWRAAAYGDSHIYVTDGTKGGKHRMIPISNERQRQVVAAAKTIVGDRLNSQMRWPDKTWRQAQGRYYYLMGLLGATHAGMGATPHGLRHGFLQDRYQHYAGVPAPVKGTGDLPPNRAEHKQAMLATSMEAGHYREAATGMYCGSLGHQLRPEKSNCRNDTNPTNEDEGDTNDEAS